MKYNLTQPIKKSNIHERVCGLIKHWNNIYK